ncbi:MAG: hypothetical protein RI953_577 [Pseudomonadota bacterium]|jgi:hypothetical protein
MSAAERRLPLKFILTIVPILFLGMTACKQRTYNTTSSTSGQGLNDFVLPNDANPDVMDESFANSKVSSQTGGRVADFEISADPKPDTDFK